MIRKVQRFSSRALMVIAPALLGAHSALASGTACPTGSSNLSVNGNNVAIPNSGANFSTSNVRLGTIGGGATGFTGAFSAGCFQTDQSFGNFSVAGNNGGQTTSNTYAFTSTGTAAQAITFSDFAQTGNGIGADTTTNDYTQTNGSNSFQFVFYSQLGSSGATNTPTANAALESIDIKLDGVAIGGSTGSITVTGVGCAGATAVVAGTFTNCTGTGGSALTPHSLTFTSGEIASGNLPLLSLFTGAGLSTTTALALDITVTVNSSSTSPTDFTTLSVDFDAPEPATFGLLGSALAGIAFLSLRKRS